MTDDERGFVQERRGDECGDQPSRYKKVKK